MFIVRIFILLILLLPLFKLQVCSFPMFCLFIILKIFIWSGNDKFYIQFLCQLQKYEKNAVANNNFPTHTVDTTSKWCITVSNKICTRVARLG
jgi:hypothetical protein